MEQKQIGELYGRMVGACRKEESDTERGAWMSVLGEFTYPELDSACRRWKADTTIEEWSSRPIGARMPDASELKASILKFKDAQHGHFAPCGKCDNGWVRVFDGLTAGWYDGGKRNRSQVDSKIGAMRECDCRVAWVQSKKSA